MPRETGGDATVGGAARAGGSAAANGIGGLVPLVVLLFFLWGFATVLNDTLIPKLKAVFALTYAEVMLTQFAFFLAYFILSLPAGFLLQRIGYIRGIALGLLAMAAGCFLFTPAAATGTYAAFLVALFVLAGGITMLQVAANPLIALLGTAENASSRLTLAQAFNSIGTTIGPFVGTALLLAGGLAQPDPAALAPAALDAYRHAEAHLVARPYAIFGLILAVLAFIFWRARGRGDRLLAPPAATAAGLQLFTRPRLALGALSIFVYVGAEVSIGSFLVNDLTSARTLGVAALDAGRLLSLYWGGMLVGRFVGSWVLTRLPPGGVLAGCALAAAILAAISGLSVGTVAAVAVIAVGLFNSIQFPTIFSLAIDGLGDDAPEGSGLLCLAIVGGAIIPLATGKVADRFGLGPHLFVPAICYLWIAAYGLLVMRGLLDRRGPRVG